MNVLEKVPSWAVEGAVGLIKVIARLVQAETDEEAEEALMQAAEVTKAALDRKKFPNG